VLDGNYDNNKGTSKVGFGGYSDSEMEDIFKDIIGIG
jgi:hypothetical protein